MSGSTTTFVWDDESTPNLLTDGSNSYLYGPDGLPIEQIGGTASYWYVHDQAGSTLLLLDASGAQAGGYSRNGPRLPGIQEPGRHGRRVRG